MQHREDGAAGQAPGVKAERDVEEDEQQREEQRPHGADPQLVPDLRADDIELHDLRARIDSLEGGVELPADLGRRLPRIGGRRMATSREEPKFCTCGS